VGVVMTLEEQLADMVADRNQLLRWVDQLLEEKIGAIVRVKKLEAALVELCDLALQIRFFATGKRRARLLELRKLVWR
jgi:hypothetical protein